MKQLYFIPEILVFSLEDWYAANPGVKKAYVNTALLNAGMGAELTLQIPYHPAEKDKNK